MTTNYTIKSGDSLSQIAESNNTTVAAILKANPSIKNANSIRAGQSITIPTTSSEIDYKAKQAFVESTMDPSKTSPQGAKGLYQFMPKTMEWYQKETGNIGDPYDPTYSSQMRDYYMDYLLNQPFINKPNQTDSVHHAKALVAYNWGEGNLLNFLNDQKKQGVNIYTSLDWINSIPNEEARNYVQKILLEKGLDKQGFDKLYKNLTPEQKKAYGFKKSGGQINYLNLFK